MTNRESFSQEQWLALVDAGPAIARAIASTAASSESAESRSASSSGRRSRPSPMPSVRRPSTRAKRRQTDAAARPPFRYADLPLGGRHPFGGRALRGPLPHFHHGQSALQLLDCGQRGIPFGREGRGHAEAPSRAGQLLSEHVGRYGHAAIL